MKVQMTIESLDTDHKGFSRSESESPRETFAAIFGVAKAGLQSFMDHPNEYTFKLVARYKNLTHYLTWRALC